MTVTIELMKNENINKNWMRLKIKNYFWVQNCTFELKLVQTFSSTTLSVHFKKILYSCQLLIRGKF